MKNPHFIMKLSDLVLILIPLAIWVGIAIVYSQAYENKPCYCEPCHEPAAILI